MSKSTEKQQGGAWGARLQLAPVNALKAYERNSLTHSDEQITQLVASLAEFGMVGGIVVRDGVIAKGHGTLAAIRRLYAAGQTLYHAPGESAGGEAIPAGMVPVIDASGWTEAQFRAYVIADNKLGRNSDWNDAFLLPELGELKAFDFNMAAVGFTDDEVDRMLEEKTVLPEKTERLRPVRYVRMLVSIPVGVEVKEADAFVRAVTGAGGRVDYAGN